MKKILNYLLMAATVCGISLAAASCSSNDDNPATPDLNLRPTSTHQQEEGI